MSEYDLPEVDGPWPQPLASWVLPFGDDVYERWQRRVELAVDACLEQLRVGRFVTAVAARRAAIPMRHACDAHGNLWLVAVDSDGEPWGFVAAAGTGLWFLPEHGGYSYVPDPLLDDDLVAERGLPPGGPYGDAGPLIPVEP